MGQVESFSSSAASPAFGRRACSVAIDGIAYLLVCWILWFLARQLGSSLFAPPPPSSDPRTAADLLAELPAILGANLFLALGNARGTSPGKAMTGTRLVARGGDALVRPGMRRGLVRATLQWFPIPRAGLAGTHVVVAECQDWTALPPRSPRPPALPAWMVVFAVSAQCLFAIVLMFASAF